MKQFLIIGASSGIGKQLTEQLLSEGHRVFGTYRNTKVDSTHANVSYHYLDVMEDSLSLDFLPSQLDGLVYCPGSINLKPFARIQPQEYITDYELNVVGAVKVLQAVLPLLKKSKNPAVVFFSTVAVQVGFQFHSQVAASKGALEGLTRALAAELAPTIRVNCIAPSLTDTPLAAKLLSSEEKKQANAKNHPLQKIGSPIDLAEMAAFLLSEKSKWITSQIIHVDGGMSKIKS